MIMKRGIWQIEPREKGAACHPIGAPSASRATLRRVDRAGGPEKRTGILLFRQCLRQWSARTRYGSIAL